MAVKWFACAAVLAAIVPTAAAADDPNDPAMRSSLARERDRETIRRLNLQELARVRARDARYAEGWRAARAGDLAANDHAARSRDHDRAMASYARSRAAYERAMVEWRQAVAACRAGDYSACER